MISNLQFSLSFWRSAIMSCERAMPGYQKFDHTFVRPTRTFSAEGFTGQRKIRTSLSPHFCVRPARSPHTGQIEFAFHHPFVPGISAERHEDTFAFHHTLRCLTRTISAEGCPRRARCPQPLPLKRGNLEELGQYRSSDTSRSPRRYFLCKNSCVV